MKKLVVLLITILLIISTYGQTSLFGGAYNPFENISMCEQSQVDGYKTFLKSGVYSSTYRFFANDKYYMLSYESYQSYEKCAEKSGVKCKEDISIKYYHPWLTMRPDDKVERNFRLYRLDDTVNMVWNLASEDIIDNDYHYFAGTIYNNIRFFDIYFSAIDDEYGNYVKSLPDGNIEMCILRHYYTDFNQSRYKKYYHKIIVEPIGNEMYKIITIQ